MAGYAPSDNEQQPQPELQRPRGRHPLGHPNFPILGGSHGSLPPCTGDDRQMASSLPAAGEPDTAEGPPEWCGETAGDIRNENSRGSPQPLGVDDLVMNRGLGCHFSQQTRVGELHRVRWGGLPTVHHWAAGHTWPAPPSTGTPGDIVAGGEVPPAGPATGLSGRHQGLGASAWPSVPAWQPLPHQAPPQPCPPRRLALDPHPSSRSLVPRPTPCLWFCLLPNPTTLQVPGHHPFLQEVHPELSALSASSCSEQRGSSRSGRRWEMVAPDP